MVSLLKLSKVEELIINNSSKYNMEKGIQLLKDKKVLKLNVHKIDNLYNLYGSFKENSSNKLFSSHLKIDTKSEKIVSCKCGCNFYLDLPKYDRNIYLCEHLVATGLNFIEIARTNLKKKTSVNKHSNVLDRLYCVNEVEIMNNPIKKRKLDLNVCIKEIILTDEKWFDISLYINNGHSYLVLSLKEWLYSYFNNKNYIIGKGFIYKPEKHYFSKEDINLLEYLYEYSFELSQSKNTIRISENFLRRLFSNLINKKVKFTFNYVTYICDVKNLDLPLSFTLKKIKGDYILTTKKNQPIPLNKRYDVFIYNKDIYVPSMKQIEVYKILLSELKNKNNIIFNKDFNITELRDLLIYLKNASKNIYLSDDIIEFINKNTEVTLNFKKKFNKFFCDVSLICEEKEINYTQVISDKELSNKYHKKIQMIEGEMNKWRFYYRNESFEFLGTDDEHYMFLKEGLNNLGNFAKIINLENSKYYKFKTLNFKEFDFYKNSENKYAFSYELNDISKDDFYKITDGYKNNNRYIKLSDNTYVDLQDKENSRILDILDILDIEKDSGFLDINKIYYLNEKIKSCTLFSNVQEKIQKVINKINDLDKLDFEIPNDLNGYLRNYQIEGYKWFKSLSYLNLGGILSDEMGLGKTIQTITFLLSEKDKKSLIVVPTSLIYNWILEFNKFAPSLRVGLIYGSVDERKNILSDINDYDILITTYGLLKKDIDYYEKINFQYLILDEGQNINNYKTQVATTVRKINSKVRFVLTGTPIENNLMELWSIFDFIMPGYLYSKEDFSKKFIKSEKKLLDELKLLISPYILKRNKKDVLKELPNKIENKVVVKLPKKQKELYDSLLLEIKNKINASKGQENTIELFSYLTKLRQMCLDPSLLVDNYNDENGKLRATKEIILNNISEHKIVVFSQFTSMLKRIENTIKENDIEYVYLDGSTTAKKRLELVEEFNNNNNIKVFLISLKAGGTGLNLTSSDIVIHFDPWYNPAIHDQASDRTHRIGQKNVVNVYKLIAKDTIEETIFLMQEDKKNLISEVLENDYINKENIIDKLNNREIINIILR